MTTKTHPEPGTLYRRRHGYEYRVVSVARHEASYEWLVIYQSPTGNGGDWAIPINEFHNKFVPVLGAAA